MQRLVKWSCYLVIAYLLFVGTTILLAGLSSIIPLPPSVGAFAAVTVVVLATPGIYRWIRSKLA